MADPPYHSPPLTRAYIRAMSSLPNDNRDILREMIGTKWHDDYIREREREAVDRLIEEDPEVADMLQRVRDGYLEMERSYRPGWREYRNFTGRTILEKTHDVDDLRERFEEHYRDQ